jgi:hypothetical protein
MKHLGVGLVEPQSRDGVLGKWYKGFSPRSAAGYDGEDQWADWKDEFVQTEWAATYRWAARMKDGSIVDYCEGDVSIYPASENPNIEKVWEKVLEYVR